MIQDTYIIKKEVDWSLLTEGFAIPYENQTDAANPVFDRRTLAYVYGNGMKETLAMNRHLVVSS